MEDDDEEEAGDAIDDGAKVIGDFNRRDCAVDNTWRDCACSTPMTKTMRVANGRRRGRIAPPDDMRRGPVEGPVVVGRCYCCSFAGQWWW